MENVGDEPVNAGHDDTKRWKVRQKPEGPEKTRCSGMNGDSIWSHYSTLQTKKLETGEHEGRSRREQMSRKRPLHLWRD